MEEIKNGHGGKRSNCGRKPKGRNVKVTFRVTDQVAAIIKAQKNQNDYLEALILGTPVENQEGSKKDTQ